MRLPVFARSAAASCLLVAACGSPALSPEPSPDGSPGAGATMAPVVATAARDGVTVTLVLDREAVGAGETIGAWVEVRNTLPGVVLWQGGGCDLLNGFGLQGPELPDPPVGQEWPGTAGLAKWSATASGLRHTSFLPDTMPPEQDDLACPADLRVNELPFGEPATAQAEWRGRTSDTAPAPAGEYLVTFSFPFLVRSLDGSFEGDPLDDRRPIEIQATFTVTGDAAPVIGQVEAIDAALADERVAAWLETLPQERLTGAYARLTGDVWRFEIGVMMPDGQAVIDLDAASGAVRKVQLPG
jgi:hypothetical protein